MSQLPQYGRMVAGKHLPYVLEARMIGTNLEWTCPRCGKFNRDVILPCKWRVICKRSWCHLGLVVGLRFGVLDDYHDCRTPIPPTARAFAEGELVAWRSGEPIHLLIGEPRDAPQ